MEASSLDSLHVHRALVAGCGPTAAWISAIYVQPFVIEPGGCRPVYFLTGSMISDGDSVQRMMSEKEKMLAGELYDPLDTQLCAERRRARLLLNALNDTRDDETEERSRLIRALIPGAGAEVWIEPPFYCDYGSNIVLAGKVFFNFNCVILDVAPVRIGAGVLFGPAVQVYAATHPMSARERSTGLEAGEPIEIGDDVWIGGGAIICPGVHIGNRAVIGAGSVVTKDIPDDVFAAGNPCKVIRAIER